MVVARVAGVVFTADPASARRDLLVIDAVAGLGEALVSGEATPDHYAVHSSGRIVRRQLVGDSALLGDADIQAIATQAKAAAAHEGHPLDLEWAIDHDGKLFWLQARPVTTLPADLNEFDTVLPRPDDVLTISNISEMMPGGVPADGSFTGWGIDYGLQYMQWAVGARPRIERHWQVTAQAYGHLFLNLSGNVVMSAAVLGSSADQTAQTVCGRIVPELVDFPRRCGGGWSIPPGCCAFALAAPKVVDRFGLELERFTIAGNRTVPPCGRSWRRVPGSLSTAWRSTSSPRPSRAFSARWSRIWCRADRATAPGRTRPRRCACCPAPVASRVR